MIYFNPVLYKHKTPDKYTANWIYVRLKVATFRSIVRYNTFKREPIYEYTKVNHLFYKFYIREKCFTFRDSSRDMIKA